MCVERMITNFTGFKIFVPPHPKLCISIILVLISVFDVKYVFMSALLNPLATTWSQSVACATLMSGTCDTLAPRGLDSLCIMRIKCTRVTLFPDDLHATRGVSQGYS